MARIDWIEHRLMNWSRWKLLGSLGGLSFARVDLTDADAGRDGYREAAIPISSVEASETNDAIERLPGELRATIAEFYVGNGGLKDKLKRLCCAERTMHDRIGKAHRLLADHFMAQQDKRKAERARNEAVLAASRP